MSLLREYIREVLEAEVKPQVQPESQIFCDMDGVLVDFETAVVAMVNRLLDGGPLEGSEVSKSYRKKLRKVQRELGPDWRAKGRPDLDLKPVRDFMMTAIGINPGPVFAGMPPHADALSALWPYLNSTGRVVNILSAPISSRPGATSTTEEGKNMWIEEHLDPQPASVIITPAIQKKQHAVSGGVPNILIDDKASTVDAWNKAGGIAVLHTPKGSSASVKALQDLGV